MLLSFGFQENIGSKEGDKFDSISHDLDSRIFVSCDGANSTPWGGEASRLCSDTLLNSLKAKGQELNVKTVNSYGFADSLLKEQFHDAACTGISAEISSSGIFLASCGDSLIEIYEYRTFLGWKKTYASELDLLDDKNAPSQLIGSPAYNKPNLKFLDPSGVIVILLMSDGLYRYTTPKDRLKLIENVGRHAPSQDDLTFLSSTIADIALKNKSHDDISIGMVWLDMK